MDWERSGKRMKVGGRVTLRLMMIETIEIQNNNNNNMHMGIINY